MFNTLWKKGWRDLWTRKARSLFVIAAIATSSLTLGTILVSYHLLDRDMNGGFLGANPHHLSLNLDRVDETTLAELAMLPEIKEIEARFVAFGRIRNTRGVWRQLLLFSAPKFDEVTIDVMTPDTGPWPPKPGHVSIERQALSVLESAVGDEVYIEMNDGETGTLLIGGIVHDVVLPQAEWENIVYGYIDFDSLGMLNIKPRLNQIKIVLAGQPTKKIILEEAEKLKDWFESKGIPLENIKAENPGMHPHHQITSQMFLIMKIFGWFCCIFSTVLVVNLLTAALATEKRQIGVMKAMGGNGRQIARIYVTSVLCLGGIAVCISLPLIVPAGFIMAEYFAKMMNFDIENMHVPLWILAVQLGVGIGLPLLVCYLPIRSASQQSIRASLTDYGLGNRGDKPGGAGGFLARLLSTPQLISMRSTFRRKARLVLNIAVLGLASALMIASFNLDATIASFVDGINGANRWDLRIRLSVPVPVETLGSVTSLDEVDAVTTLFYVRAETKSEHGHGLRLIGIDANTRAIQPLMLKGHRLSGAPDEILISQSILETVPGLEVGDTLGLESSLGEHQHRVVGVFAGLGGSTAYVDASFFVANNITRTDYFYVSTNAPNRQAEKALTRYFEERGNDIASITTPEGMWRAVIDHFEIIFRMVVLLAVMLGLIGINGIFSSMGTSLMERTREFGILKAIGASKAMLLRIVLYEGIAIGLIGWIIAVLAALPMSKIIATQMGMVLLGAPLALTISFLGISLSLILVPAISALACLFPALKSANRPVKESLIYE